MKIKTEYGHLVDIFGIYWTISVDKTLVETILLGLPRGNGGLTAYRIIGTNTEQVEIVDPSMSSEFIYYKEGIFHRALIEEQLLDDIQEYDPTAYQRFLEIIKSEGLVDEDFE